MDNVQNIDSFSDVFPKVLAHYDDTIKHSQYCVQHWVMATTGQTPKLRIWTTPLSTKLIFLKSYLDKFSFCQRDVSGLGELQAGGAVYLVG